MIIHGCAQGADTIAGEIAREFELEVEEYPALWDEYGRAAGPIRNQQMLDEGEPDEVWAFHEYIEESKGTKDMVKRSRKAGVPAYIFVE